MTVKKVESIYAANGEESEENMLRNVGLLLRGSIAMVNRFNENRTKPIKKIGFPAIFIFFGANLNRKPTISRIGATGVEVRRASWAVRVVPILLPKIIARLS